jgi:hypothetical protein
LPNNINEYEYPVQEELREVEVPKSKTKRYVTKFRVGSYVCYYLDHPVNALGKKRPTAARREGDYNWSRTGKELNVS